MRNERCSVWMCLLILRAAKKRSAEAVTNLQCVNRNIFVYKSNLFKQFLRYFLLHNLFPMVGNVSPVYVMYIKHVSSRRKRRFIKIVLMSTKYEQTRYHWYTILFAYLFDKSCQCNHLNTDSEMTSHLEVEDSL